MKTIINWLIVDMVSIASIFQYEPNVPGFCFLDSRGNQDCGINQEGDNTPSGVAGLTIDNCGTSPFRSSSPYFFLSLCQYIRIIIKFECLFKLLGVLCRPDCVSFSGLICAHSLYLIINLCGIKTSVANTYVLS